MKVQPLILAAVLAAAGLGQAADEKKEETPKPKITQDGADVVSSFEVTANNSPHALLVTSEGPDDALVLKYLLVQNTTGFVRSQKQVTVEWRLVGRKEKDAKVLRVERMLVNAKTGEIQVLAEQLKKVIEAGEKKGG